MTAIDILINEMFEVDRVLVIAPKRVAEDTWTREHAKWDHLRHLRVSKVLGSPEQRRRALVTDADIYVIGRDNVVWLVDLYQKLKTGWPFDMIVIDELSSFKNPQAKRFRALRKVMPRVSRVVGLTGTPSANGLMDLWAEIYLLDRGERLGQTLGAYREKYFRPGARNGYIVFKWEPLRGAREKIEAAISDICISMSAADYLKLPKRIDNRIPVKLSPQEMKQYKTMEAEQLLHIDDEDVVALNAAAVMTKLLQIANGSVYSHEGNVVRLHNARYPASDPRGPDFGRPGGHRRVERWRGPGAPGASGQCGLRPQSPGGRPCDRVVRPHLEPGTLPAGQRPPLSAGPGEAGDHPPPDRRGHRGRAGHGCPGGKGHQSGGLDGSTERKEK